MRGIGGDNGWLEAAIAWEVCASLHRQYCNGKDALFTTRQSDFVKHAENARGRAAHGQAPADLSPTAGMNIAQRILHVGGRNNDAGYVEFGSIQAVEALVRQVLRDLPAPAPAESVQEDAARDHIRALIAQHADILEQNESAYFELCYHRATGWMAWITDKPLCMPPVINPGRTVLAQGQGDTPDEACADAARKQGGAT